MPFNSSGAYVPISGSETAAPGQTIASATWNAIFTDIATALTTLGQGGVFPVGKYLVAVKGISFNLANTDNAVAITLPPGTTNYRIEQAIIANASTTLNPATVGLYTATGAGGFAIVTSSTAVTVTSSASNTANNMQVLTVNNQSNQSYSLGTLQLRTQTVSGVNATADVILYIQPLP